MAQEIKALDGGVAVGYVRVSGGGADDQSTALTQEQSIPAQERAIMEYAEAHGVQIVAWYTDVGQGRDLPGLERLMSGVGSPDLGFDTVLVWKFSRLNRDGVNRVQIMSELQEAGVTLVSVTEPDVCTPVGLLTHDLIKTVDEFQRQFHSEETRRGIAAARRRREGL